MTKEIDMQGRGAITVTSSLDLEDLAAGGYDSNFADHYCDLYQQFSNDLWISSNGQHYIKKARFFAGLGNVDIIWKQTGADANASFLGRIHMPYIGATPNLGDSGKTLNHEFGHFYYRLLDEYLKADPAWGEFGVCEDVDPSSVFSDGKFDTDEACTSLPSSSCDGGSDCVKRGVCWGGTHTGKWCSTNVPSGFPAVDVNDCIALGGTCVGSSTCVLDNEGDPCTSSAQCGTGKCVEFNQQGNKLPVCVGGTGDNAVCLMSSQFTRKRWCKSDTHVHVNGDGISFEDRSALQIMAYEQLIASTTDYTCWDLAAMLHADLEIPQSYTSLVSLGTPPAIDCDWFVDETLPGLIANAQVFVDLSGSMMVNFAADTNMTAWQGAVAGAEFFRKSADSAGASSYLGVYGFQEDVFPLTTVGNVDLDLGPVHDPSDLIDPTTISMDPQNMTNICGVLTDAEQIYDGSQAPLTDRNVVLLTDGVHTYTSGFGGVDCDLPQLAANLCASGTKVHVVAYGNADVEMLEAIATAGCGMSAYTPQISGGLTQPHALQHETGAMRVKLAGTSTLWSERVSLTGANSDVLTFHIPPGTTKFVLGGFGDADTFTGNLKVFNELDFWITSPSSTLYNFGVGTEEENGRFRELVVDNPEAGIWEIEIDTTAVPAIVRPDHVIGWTVSIRHPSIYSKAWTAKPEYTMGTGVPIRAFLGRQSLLTDINVVAKIVASGATSTVALYDDGLHGDDAPGDGIYGAKFQPTSYGLHVATVTLHAEGGVARTVPGEQLLSTGTDGTSTTITDDVDAYENFAFQVVRSGTFLTSELLGGFDDGSWLDYTTGEPDDLFALEGYWAGSEAGDELACVASTCRAFGRGGDDFLVAEPSAELTELHGGQGADVLIGGRGADILVPGPGADFVIAGDGDDFVVLRHACELERGKSLEGGEGEDTLVIPTGVDHGSLNIVGFENVVESDELGEWSECKND